MIKENEKKKTKAKFHLVSKGLGLHGFRRREPRGREGRRRRRRSPKIKVWLSLNQMSFDV